MAAEIASTVDLLRQRLDDIRYWRVLADGLERGGAREIQRLERLERETREALGRLDITA